MPNNDVEISVRTTGMDQAAREVQAFIDIISRLKIDGVAPLPSSSPGLPIGASPDAPRPSNGLDPMSGIGASAVDTLRSFGQLEGGGVFGPGQITMPKPVPPTPPGDGLSSIRESPVNGSYAGLPPISGSGDSRVINAQTVVINSPSTPGGTGGGAGPGNGLGGASSGVFQDSAGHWRNSSGSFAVAPPDGVSSGAAPAAEVDSAGAAAAQSGSLGTGGIPPVSSARNPLPGWVPFGNGDPGAGVKWGAGIAAVADLAGLGMRGYAAYTRPEFEANLAIHQQQLSGQYVNPITAYSQRYTARQEGEMALAQTVKSGLDVGLTAVGTLAGGIIGTPADLVSGPLGTVLGAVGGGAAGHGIALGTDAAIDVFWGRGVERATATQKADADRNLAYVQYLRRTGNKSDQNLANSIMSAYASNNPDSITQINNRLQDPNLDTQAIRSNIASMSSVRALGGGAVSNEFGSQSLINAIRSGTDPNDIAAGENAYMGAINNPAMGNLRQRYQSGAPIDMQKDILQQFIASNDTQSIQYLQSRGLVTQAQADDAQAQAYSLAQTGVGVNIAQSNLSVTQSRIGQSQYQGASLASIGAATTASASLYDPIISGLQQQMAQQANEQDRLKIAAQIAAAQQSQASTYYQGVMTGFQGRSTLVGAYQSLDTTALAVTMGSGGGSDKIGAIDIDYGKLEKEARAQAQIALDKSRAKGPDGKFLDGIEARTAEFASYKDLMKQANIDLQRSNLQTDIGIAQAAYAPGIGKAYAGVVSAGLYGAPSEVASTQNALATEQLQQKLKGIDMQLNDPRAHLAPGEAEKLQGERTQAMADFEQQIVSITRNLKQMELGVASTTLAITSAQSSQAVNNLGFGGAAASGMFGKTLNAASDRLAAAQGVLSNLDKQGVDKNSQTYKDAQQAVVGALGDQYAAGTSVVTPPLSATQQNTLNTASTNASILGRTFASYGDVRGNLDTQLQVQEQALAMTRAAAAKIPDVIATEAKDKPWVAAGVSESDWRSGRRSELELANNNQANQQRSAIADTQQQLQTGWMDRLISQTYNMPERGAYVASRFTMREAMPFVQGITSAYGTNNLKDRDHWRFYGDRIANMDIGNISRPGGFEDTAMALNGNYDGTGVMGGKGLPSTVPLNASDMFSAAAKHLSGDIAAARNAGPLVNPNTVQFSFAPATATIIIKDTSGNVRGQGNLTFQATQNTPSKTTQPQGAQGPHQ